MAKAKRSRGLSESSNHLGITYQGGREQLIAAGLAKPEQFPGAPGCGAWSTTFRPKDGRPKFRVARYTRRLYQVEIYWTREQRAEYEKQARAGYEAEQAKYREQQAPEVEHTRTQAEKAELEQRQRDIAAIKRRLPPFVGNLSDAELEHLRVLRALNDETWGILLMTAENLLLSNATSGQLAQPLRVAHLALVVDNDRQR